MTGYEPNGDQNVIVVFGSLVVACVGLINPLNTERDDLIRDANARSQMVPHSEGVRVPERINLRIRVLSMTHERRDANKNAWMIDKHQEMVPEHIEKMWTNERREVVRVPERVEVKTWVLRTLERREMVQRK